MDPTAFARVPELRLPPVALSPLPLCLSACLRAGWSIGNGKERYLHYECAGDQFTGRTVTGLDVMDKTFAVSPPYFEGDDNVKSAVETNACKL